MMKEPRLNRRRPLDAVKRSLWLVAGALCLVVGVVILGVFAYHAFHHGVSARARAGTACVAPLALVALGGAILWGAVGPGRDSDAS